MRKGHIKLTDAVAIVMCINFIGIVLKTMAMTCGDPLSDSSESTASWEYVL